MSLIFSQKSCQHFPLEIIQKATDSFNQSNIIGIGGFGSVYKGSLFVDGSTNPTLVAVKRLNPDSKQGFTEFETEIKMLSKFRHCHLVNLLGYCNEHQEMILVYEYMSNGTLADHLFKNINPLLTWEQLLKICIGAARGLDYLHTGTGIGILDRVIHLDVKSANILLDENYAAKIADLGLAKTGPANQPYNSEVMTKHVRGTPGYIDPQYLKNHKFSRKADVYSFGMVLLEVLSGTRALGGEIIPDQRITDLGNWIQQHITNSTLSQIIHLNVKKSQIQPKCLEYFANIARFSLHNHPDQRPSMSDVVSQLEEALACQLQTNSSTSTVEDDDVLHENTLGISMAKYLGKAHNIFGEPITNKTMVQRGLTPTRENKAQIAYNMMNHGNKYDNALLFVRDLKAQWGNGISTLCLLYNATGETLTYATSLNWLGHHHTQQSFLMDNGVHICTQKSPRCQVDLSLL